MSIIYVQVRTNPEISKSRLMNSMYAYIKKSILTVLRAFLMYRPLQVFTLIAAFFLFGGVAIGIRFLYFFFTDGGNGHIQSLILAMMLIIIGVQTFLLGLQADVISANRKLLEDIQFIMKKLEFGVLNPDGTKKEKNDSLGTSN